MKILFDWTSTFIVFMLFAGMVPINDCRVLDFFSKDSSSSNGSESYTPPTIPETLEQERPFVKARINELVQALESKNIDKILELCDNQEGYRENFENNVQNLPKMADSLKTADLTMISPGYGRNGSRCGEVSVNMGSHSYAIPVVKRSGKWFFQDL